MSSDRHKRAGFTLIEIAAALMVFGLLSMTILVAQGYMTRRARIFLEAFQDLAEAKSARLKLERDQKLAPKERIDIPDTIPPVSYQFTSISEKSTLHDFSKMVGIGMIEIKQRNGFTDRFFSIVPLPIEIKTGSKAPEKKPELEKPENPAASKLTVGKTIGKTVGRPTAGKKNG